MTKEKIIVVESENEKIAGKVWHYLGKNNGQRRKTAFALLVLILGAVLLALFIIGKYDIISATFTK